ncbi:MAG: ArsR family transcriptional regulator, partial [Candidatus Lokiarchaeota archaeon]|nr:ArsR family transcriptional regulator [Candidatus Lokiarchaeota archaeon]
MANNVLDEAKDLNNVFKELGKAEDIVKKIVKHPLRMLIFLLLYIYPELNVTEVSKKLNRSKATVSRHLKAMKNDEILKVREEKVKGRINPK